MTSLPPHNDPHALPELPPATRDPGAAPAADVESTESAARVIRGFYAERLERILVGDPGLCRRAGTSPAELLAARCGVPLAAVFDLMQLVQLALFPEDFGDDPDVKAELESICPRVAAAPVLPGPKQPGTELVATDLLNGEKVERLPDGSLRRRVPPRPSERTTIRGWGMGALDGLVPPRLPTVTAPEFAAFAREIRGRT